MTDSSPIEDVREAELFRDNGRQAVRIPAEFEFADSSVFIRKEGNRLIVEPKRKKANLVEILRTMSPIDPDDDFPDDMDETYPINTPPCSR